jgi:protein SCO1/2
VSAHGWAKQPGNSGLIGVALIVALLALAMFASAALWRTFGHNPAAAPDFTLSDQNGQPFTLSKFRAHPIALFFGFTHCPDECPTTLAHLAHAVHAPGVPLDTRAAFIAVDPERDSPASLKRYVRLFDPQFIGLTGGLNQLNPVYDAYHTARQAVPVNQTHRDESFEHGTTVFYVGRDGMIKGLGQGTTRRLRLHAISRASNDRYELDRHTGPEGDDHSSDDDTLTAVGLAGSSVIARYVQAP